jgi:hypothetical protein
MIGSLEHVMSGRDRSTLENRHSRPLRPIRGSQTSAVMSGALAN